MSESSSESHCEPEWESQRAIESQGETGREPARVRESHRESQLEQDKIRLSFVAIRQNTVFFFQKLLT